MLSPGEDHRAEAGRLRLRHGPKLRRLRAAEGPRAGRARRSCCVSPRCSIPTARSTRTNLRGARVDRYLYPQGRGRGGLAAAVHLPRLPLRRGDRLSRPARTRTPSPASSSTRTFRWSASSSAPARWSTGSTRISSGRSGRTTSRCPPIARSATSGWAGRATPRRSSARRPTTPTWRPSSPSGWSIVDDAQAPTGDFPDVAPTPSASAAACAAWADAGTICPWTIYQVYSDRRLLAKHYRGDGPLGRVSAASNSKGLLRPAAGYGDWLSIERRHAEGRASPRPISPTARNLTADAARVLGKTRRRPQVRRAVSARSRRRSTRRYVAADGRIKGNTQTCYVLALAFDLLPEENRPAAARVSGRRHQVRAACTYRPASSARAVLMPTLSASRQTPIGLQAAAERHVPLMGLFDQARGDDDLGTLGRLDAGKGFPRPRHESFAHYSFGAVARWMFQTRGRHRHGRARASSSC